MQQRNLLLAIALSLGILVGWSILSRQLWPPPPKPTPTEVAKTDDKDKPKGDEAKKPAAKDKAPDKKEEQKKERERIVAADLQQVPVTASNDLVHLGAREGNSRFHLFVELDPRGAGVWTVWLNKYQAADPFGRPRWLDDEKKLPAPLVLIPPHRDNVTAPSFQLFAYDVNDPSDEQPLDTLGRVNWKVVEQKTDEVDGRQRQSVSFQTQTQGVIVTKTYSLTEGEYHLGLEVKMRRKDGADKALPFRYQLTGAHGLPVEGKWYTGTFRNAMIGVVDNNGTVARDLQTLQQISNWGGGNPVPHDPGAMIGYSIVANQYFASGILVDNDQKNRGFLHMARPTLEAALTRGKVVSVAEDGFSFVLKPSGKEPERTFYMPPGARTDSLGEGKTIAVLHHTASAPRRSGEYPEIVNYIYLNEETAPPAAWVDDITVRVSTEPVQLRGEVEEVHKYLLYNGPVKVSQLFPPPGLSSKPLEEGGVPPELYDRYHDVLHLNTLTDYHSPGAVSTFFSKIGWTGAIIFFTNIMHAVLGYLHSVIPSAGLCIIVLTVLVRGLMFPLSRKQALMSVRMQQLAPELKKLQEKYKDDRQALGMEQMALYRKHGVNPFGTCWVLLLQMPVFMGLYFALQESTRFRLAEFWPTWIANLAAPDMLFGWGSGIPFISRVEDYGSPIYLGPFFNLLPVIAVALMIVQQKMITPPPADEQQAAQQKMMKYMMIIMGVFFYKMAAGLCLYFIATTTWGFCERKLLPKKKIDAGEPATPPREGYWQKLLRKAQGEQVTAAPATGITTRNGGITVSPEPRGRSGGKRRRDRDKRRQGAVRGPEAETEDDSMLGRWRKRLHDWWVAVLKEAEKKNRG